MTNPLLLLGSGLGLVVSFSAGIFMLIEVAVFFEKKNKSSSADSTTQLHDKIHLGWQGTLTFLWILFGALLFTSSVTG